MKILWIINKYIFPALGPFSLLKLKMTQSMILGILAALGLSTEFEPRAEKNIFVGKVVLGYPWELKFKSIEKKSL